MNINDIHIISKRRIETNFTDY